MISNSILVLSILLLSFFPTLSTSAFVSNDDIAIIRQRVLDLTVWPTTGNIPATVRNAISYSRSLNSSCYWADINYADKSIVVWSTATHMYRITTMLQALTVNGSSVKNDLKIMSNVHCALNIWFAHDWQNPNWWFNQINIPLQATSQLLMLGDNATSLEIKKIEEISYRAAWWLHRPQDVGANLVWMIQCQLYRSLATVNITGIEQGFSRMWQDVAISPLGGEGVQYDWSYHFHGLQLLSGAYGLVWANNILLFLQCSQNTQYQPADEILLLFVNFLTKGDAWMIMQNQWDWHVVGRGVAGPGNGFAHGLVTDWIRSIAQLVKNNETRIELLNFASRLDNLPNTPLLIGNNHFFVSDYQVHRRANWIFTIKMQSIRTQPVECINGQNLKDEHGGQGVLNLYRIGFNDYSELFAIIDWQAINGITVEHDIPLEPCKSGNFDMQRLSFVGGVSDGQYGLAMMDTASHNLTAKRSWHFYDDAIIALATNLTLTTPTTAWTTLASRLLRTGQITIGFFNSTVITLNDGNYSFPYLQGKTSNVQWIHVGGSNIGYLLQLQQQYNSLGIEVAMKTGNYDAIGPFNSTVTARMLTLYINHGVGPYTLDYNYMILPNVTLESIPTLIKQYNEEQVFACVSTNNLFHGTMWPTLKRASFVLWDNITTTFSCKSSLFNINIQLSDAGTYLYSETATDFTVTASHPMRINNIVKVVVDRIGHGKECAVSSNVDATTTTITLMLPSSPQMLGESVNATCKK
jgi:chondroitin AC lyase